MKQIDIPEDFQIYGWTPKDILTVQRWLYCQNATIEDLQDASLDWHRWSRQRIHGFLSSDFKE